jgi:hypothetical protein
MAWWLGVVFIFLGLASLGLFLFRDKARRNLGVPLDPKWQIVANSLGIVLIGVESVWPQYQVSKIGMVLIAIPLMPRAIQMVREFFRDSFIRR